jgi:hypothetical protein
MMSADGQLSLTTGGRVQVGGKRPAPFPALTADQTINLIWRKGSKGKEEGLDSSNFLFIILFILLLQIIY